jgi:GNAT superfamily N-acetyltransferase
VRIRDGLSDQCAADCVDLVFEYMAVTLGESGRAIPGTIAQLPAVLRRECEDLAACYSAPGALFVAYQGDQPAGCLGLAPASLRGALEVRRLYVRPAHRGRGVARLLMERAHHHAQRPDFERLVLDVMPARGHVIDFYRRLGYAECEPFATESPIPMLYMQRLVTREM